MSDLVRNQNVGFLMTRLNNYQNSFFFQSKEWITTLKMNGSVNSLAFTNDGTKLFSHGGKLENITCSRT